MRLLFYFLVLASIPTIGAVVWSFADRNSRRGWLTLRIYLIVVALYAAVLISSSLALPIRVLSMGVPQYSDDWSISVTSLRRIPHEADEDYNVDFRLYNRGQNKVSSPKRLVAYLLDEKGTRYNAVAELAEPAFDVALRPLEPMVTTRRFVLPRNLNRVELVLTVEGFRPEWFIIGRTPFDGRTVIQLQ